MRESIHHGNTKNKIGCNAARDSQKFLFVFLVFLSDSCIIQCLKG